MFHFTHCVTISLSKLHSTSNFSLLIHFTSSLTPPCSLCDFPSVILGLCSILHPLWFEPPFLCDFPPNYILVHFTNNHIFLCDFLSLVFILLFYCTPYLPQIYCLCYRFSFNKLITQFQFTSSVPRHSFLFRFLVTISFCCFIKLM